MNSKALLHGFSKLPATGQIAKIADYTSDPETFKTDIGQHNCSNSVYQARYNNFSENTIANYYLPFSIAPNFVINNRVYHVPMVTEESSVVAAAASAAKFWSVRGGFSCKVINTVKTGQVHFTWKGPAQVLMRLFEEEQFNLKAKLCAVTKSMEKRGGGIQHMELLYRPDILEDYYQLHIEFNTIDSMGANFINTVLEMIAHELKLLLTHQEYFKEAWKECEIIMCILSNYTPQCMVSCSVETPVDRFNEVDKEMSGSQFANKFYKAVTIANNDIYRATTHNKGVMNGIDAVALATGNDFRAIEANVHTYAARSGSYSGLTEIEVSSKWFAYTLKLPLAVATVGGVTAIHPMVKHSLDILQSPDSNNLMMIMAAAGMANNFSAIRALITSGIQQGHMKLHLTNIAGQLEASAEEMAIVQEHFRGKIVSYVAVKDLLNKLRRKDEGI